MNKFQEMTAELEQALSGISFEKLDISDEVKEQVRYDPSFGLYFDVVVVIACACLFITATSIFCLFSSQCTCDEMI